jgi:hypothetical protein
VDALKNNAGEYSPKSSNTYGSNGSDGTMYINSASSGLTPEGVNFSQS